MHEAKQPDLRKVPPRLRVRSRLECQLFIRRVSRGCQDSWGERMLVTVTAPHQSQCYVRLPFSDLTGRRRQFKDLMGPVSYDRDENDLTALVTGQANP